MYLKLLVPHINKSYMIILIVVVLMIIIKKIAT